MHKTRNSVLIQVVLLLVFGFVASTTARAESLLISQESPYGGYGYGLYSWGGMTNALNSAFGASNITVDGSDLNSLSYMLGFDRLWVTARQPYGQALSATEIANIEAYIGTGRRVVLIGENGAWSSWNNSILSTVGGYYSGYDTSDTLTPVVFDSLTAGVNSLNTIADGLAVGGTSLFNENVATLWGTNQNTLSLLSVNVEDDYYGSGAGNVRFKTNMADWLAGSSVPEPATITLLATGLAGVFSLRKRRKAVR
ncbi:MAG: PEP-CTERM sorting domain-containing protein [Terriglobia bacterium]|jgi:hypothetical protein